MEHNGVEPGNAIISLSRSKSVSNLFRQFSVLIDDKKVGKIKSGETKRFRVPAGRHAVRVSIDLYKSKLLLLDLAAGETIPLECGDTAPKTLRESFSLKGLEKSLNSLVKPKQYLYVRTLNEQSGAKAQPRPAPAALEPKPGKTTPAGRPGCSIFVSYRREDSLHVTSHICTHLCNQFGRESVFRDLDSMPLGVDFRRHIEQTIGDCSVLLAIIGKDWLDAVDPSGRRRLDDPGDPVRVEIESALKRQIPVIPILVKGAPMPEEDQLPDTIKQLKYQAGISIHEDYFQAGMERLIKQLQNTGRADQSSAPPGIQKFCNHCGAEIGPGNKFCIHCGRPA